ncbi:chondroitin sulfate proteoglycan 4 isoform X1 [Hypomesus transpacificus]|uniref:chondroitin sulfate proteoglycan 4 isoform X1 n=2 Tax=Hypomesus transpacificus TaxID=137520 RepID=UPI001F08502B|nr:chondroitin sulfate proteoglycan 4 isoform X1 [Hypomesus transpacificus]
MSLGPKTGKGSSLNGEHSIADYTGNMKTLLFALCALVPLLCHPVHGASYFGDSFCRIQSIQDVSSFHLALQFKTSRRSGLLLMAAGMQDYMFLELRNGNLQVRMDMGTGEVALSASPGLQLNNLIEHKVSIKLQDSKLTMMIDDLFSTFIPLDESNDELNVDLGIWLGGTGDLDTPYLNNAIPPFRGCISHVNFESHQFDILEGVPTDCHDTKESCSSEFEAGDGEATSFISPDSFVSFPTWSGASGSPRTLEFLMKTTIEDALLAFHPGLESDFIAVGLVAGNLKGVVDLGRGMLVLDNAKVQLDDDQWHRVRIQIDQSLFEINVDSQIASLPINESERLDLVGNLYLGGIQGKMKDVFREGGFLDRMEEMVTSEAFIGCLGEIKVNQKDRSLQDALVTKDVHVKCEGEDYDYSSYYDGDATTTTAPVRIRYVHVDPNERHCHPTDDMPEEYQNITKLLEINSLLVPEGGEAFLDVNNLSPTFDLSNVGLQQSQIIFTLKSDPWYGLLDMNTNSRRTKTFTLWDVANKKIKYLHDGNEQYRDQIQLDVVAQSNSYLPDCFKSPHQYVLPVDIIPVNDIPQFSGEDIAITQNGRTRFSPNLIHILDSDTRCDDITVSITSEPSRDVGFLENGQQPGVSISEFTCRQLKDGNIYFVHQGGSGAGITLHVSDGQSISQSTSFKLTITQPQLNLVTNTGLLLSQGGHSTIGLKNLAVIAQPRNGDIVYNVTQALRYGELQIITSNDVYKKVTSFHHSDLEQDRLRYVSTDLSEQGRIQIEEIQFDIHLGQFSMWNNTFLVQITPSQIEMSKMVPLQLTGKNQVIKHTELQAEVKGKTVDFESVRYVLVKAPKMGTLQLIGRVLNEDDGFTQQDIWNGHISYNLQVHEAVDSQDQFKFKILVENQYSPVYTYPIQILADSDVPIMTNERLIVLEGGESVLNRDHLWVQTSSSTSFVYRVTQGPKHGRLIREAPHGQPRFEGAIKMFSNEDLLLDRLIYKHDGSDKSDDEFHFFTFKQTSVIQTDGPESVSGVFRITIQSKNDHVPIRVVDKTFNVVRNGKHLLTTDDILFTDEDPGFNDTQLVYVREGILSGYIVSNSDPSQPLFRFTQADLREKNVLFLHHGADRERFQLQVSDGLHKTSALFQIQAGEPYLHVVNNNMVVINHGSTKTLDTSLLSAESNMDIRDASEFLYQVISPPTDGKIIVSGIEASQFTQEDLKKGVVSYEHNDESTRSNDSFGFIVQAKGHSEEGTFRIQIFKQGYVSEPEVIINEILISYEGEHSVLDQDHLRLEQGHLSQAILPEHMVFSIKDPPRLGHVVKLTNDSDSTASPVLDYIDSFTQEDINRGIILYVSASVQGSDAFTVDVSNGFATVEDLQVKIDIVPRLIPVQTANFTVKEGGGKAISTDLVNISHPFYSSANVEFIVEEPPLHGNIRYHGGDEQDLNFFTWEEVKLGHVYYMHDSSESGEDSFTLSASVYEIERRSIPFTLAVTVIPVNDEPPRLTRNTGLELLAGEEADITPNMLNTKDADTPAEDLVYSVESPTNGKVALKESPEESLLNFTQAQITNGEVIFLHEGLDSGGFSFTVTDGEHTSPLYRFVVTARERTITMETQEELMVFPGTRQLISSANLGAVTNEDGHEISYSLIRPPRLGRLIIAKDKNLFEEINHFSQTELEAGAVFYEHQMPEEPFWVVRDSIMLLLSSPPAPAVHHVLPITVSYYAANRNVSSQLWRNKGLEIVQGQRKAIDSTILDASNLLATLSESERVDMDVMFEVHRFPAHGQITLGGLDLPRDTPYFMQEDVMQGDVEYAHDDSGASFDSFGFRVRLNSQGHSVPLPAQSVVLEEIFNISIRRRDSSPPELLTLDMLLEVLQGSMTILTQKHLNTRDEDSTPDEVLFTVTKAPTNGQLLDTQVMDPISEFTQDAVNKGQVGFASDGSLVDGFMEFTVSDGKHRTESYTLHIGVLARKLVLAKALEIQVKQGDDETLVTQDMLKATTGGPIEEDILYKITNVPKFAAVMVDRQPTSAFTQTQINEGRVSVRFIKSTSPRDSVAFVVRSRAANVSSVLNITVKPLVNIAQNPLIPRGATVQLDRKLLDATALANKTRSSPTFSVIQHPRGARFVRAGGSGDGQPGGSGDGQPVDMFTQKELDEGRVALEILNSTERSQGGVDQDEAHFLLKAYGVPPAECVLSFRTSPYNASGVYPVTLLRVPPESNWIDSNDLPGGYPLTTAPGPRWRGNMDWPHGDSLTTASADSASHRKPVLSRRNNLWSILIPILVILLLLLAAMCAYYLVRRNKTGKHNVQMVATSKPKNGEVSTQETFRKTDPANSIPLSNMDSKDADPELLQHCRTTDPAMKKNQYWV